MVPLRDLSQIPSELTKWVNEQVFEEDRARFEAVCDLQSAAQDLEGLEL
jgi:hypothetical protein